MTLYRHGVCDQCGECCGRATPEGSAENPWQFFWGMLHWRLEDVQDRFPHIELLDITQAADGRIVLTTTSGEVKIRGDRYPYVIDEDGVHKPGNLECPVLLEGTDPAHKYACGLAGTPYANNLFDGWCKEGPAGRGFPRLQYDDDPNGPTAQEQVDAWFESFPSCSYTFAETPE